MIEIREYTDKDFEDTVNIFTQMSTYYLKENASDKETVAANLLENIVHKDSAMTILLAYYNGEICALAAYTIMYPATKETGQMFLKELFVSPKFTRKNIGENMMSQLAKIAIKNNCSRFDWTSNKTSPSATAFYNKLEAPILDFKQYYRLAGDNLQRIAEMH